MTTQGSFEGTWSDGLRDNRLYWWEVNIHLAQQMEERRELWDQVLADSHSQHGPHFRYCCAKINLGVWGFSQGYRGWLLVLTSAWLHRVTRHHLYS